jgi:putative SOS response-associated peptidase YedK
MCGRFVQTSSIERLATLFGAVDRTDAAWSPRYNVAPSTRVPSVIQADERRIGLLTWGFVPSWAPHPGSGPRPINARTEGAAASRLFGPALARRRAVVPIDAWYEWTDEAGARQPWLMRPAGGDPLAVAALWSVWRASDAPADAPTLGTVALLTTEAHGPAATVHHRMPLVVPAELLGDWLDLTRPPAAELIGELAAAAVDIEPVRISRRVNDVHNEGPELIRPLIES